MPPVVLDRIGVELRERAAIVTFTFVNDHVPHQRGFRFEIRQEGNSLICQNNSGLSGLTCGKSPTESKPLRQIAF